MAQYSLNMSDGFYSEIRRLADEQDKTVRELIISLMKAGLVALEAHDDPHKELLFREKLEDGKVQEKLILIV